MDPLASATQWPPCNLPGVSEPSGARINSEVEVCGRWHREGLGARGHGVPPTQLCLLLTRCSCNYSSLLLRGFGCPSLPCGQIHDLRVRPPWLLAASRKASLESRCIGRERRRMRGIKSRLQASARGVRSRNQVEGGKSRGSSEGRRSCHPPGSTKCTVWFRTRNLLQQLAYVHIQRGNQLMSQRDTASAANEFSKALELDPGNHRAGDMGGDSSEAKLSWLAHRNAPIKGQH